MTIDADRIDRRRSLPNLSAGAGLLLALVALAACSDTVNYARDGGSINTRDCSEWRTESVAGCYDGQGGNGKN